MWSRLAAESLINPTVGAETPEEHGEDFSPPELNCILQ